MPEFQFDSRSSRLSLPYLFAGQAQREVYVNEALARLDALVHCAIEAQTATPPAAPLEGKCWLIGSSPTGAWSGKAGQIACWQAGQWLFAQPVPGMRVLDRTAGRDMRFDGTWKFAARPAAPSGGTTIDTESRAAITAILAALEAAGVIPPA